MKNIPVDLIKTNLHRRSHQANWFQNSHESSKEFSNMLRL